MAVVFDTSALNKLQMAMQDLRGHEKTQVMSRAINRAGDMAFTRIKRTLADEVGLPVGQTVKYGGLRKKRANGAHMNYEVISTGGYLPLKLFKLQDVRPGGVTHKAWGKQQRVPSGFVISKYGGNAYIREGKSRFPIRKLYGPAIPNELVRGESNKQMVEMAQTKLPERLDYELGALTRRIGARYGL